MILTEREILAMAVMPYLAAGLVLTSRVEWWTLPKSHAVILAIAISLPWIFIYHSEKTNKEEST